MIIYDNNSLYFLTAKGKIFMKDKNGVLGTLHSIIWIRGNIREIGAQRLKQLLQKKPYINEIYPDERTQSALTVFQIYKGTGRII